MGDYGDVYLRKDGAGPPGRSKAQNRATVQQLKLIGQSHPTGLTANLLKLFEPRAPLKYKPPLEKRKCPPYSGIGHCVSQFAEPGDPEYSPPVTKGETTVQRRLRIRALRLAKGAEKVTSELEKYDPQSDPNVEGDPYKSLFVARVSYESTEHKVKREFEAYGPVKRVRLVHDSVTGKPRGYAFIEYQHTRDMKTAYKQADGRKIDNCRVLVDVERGRTVPNWRPRRLGGGLGSTRVGGEELNQKFSGREPQFLTAAAPGSSRFEERGEPHKRDKDHERERERDREKERGGDRDQDQDRDRDRDRDYDRSADRVRDRGGRERDRERERGARDRDRHHHRADRDRDLNERERERDR